MELSMAVNYSIIQLVKKTIFCTEPFRIPFAGKVDICCFDKTGTLTQNDLVIKGLIGIQADSKANNALIDLSESMNFDRHAHLVLAGCHTLAMAENQLVGDPIEKQAFEGIKYKHDGKKTSLPQSGSGPKIF
jgi:cation-transporting ATPase 13A1